MPDEHPTPGLKRMKRHNGREDLYWVASIVAVKAGFLPKTARLLSDMPIEEISRRCLILNAEMLQWLDGRTPERQAATPGTVAWICRSFETDEHSPLHEMRKDTRAFYSRYMRMVVEKAGDRRLSRILGHDVRRWCAEWKAASGERSAYACVQALRRAVSYGCELRDPACLDLARMLERMEFKNPKARKVRPTFEQVQAVRAAAHEAGRPSIALAVALQFELGLRQKDVIGEWERLKAGESPAAGAVVDRNAVWRWGVMWQDIDAQGILRKATSKSNGSEIAEHDLKLFPDILQEMPIRGVGPRPLIVEERSGLPWRANHFSRTFRTIARAAGWPDNVWNMDSRAGAVSEAFAAGAAPVDVMRTATHTQMKTTMLYDRESLEHTTRVHQLRAARRQQPGGARSKTE